MSRSYSTFRGLQPFADGWKEANYSTTAPSDYVHRPFIGDAEGMRMPVSHYAGSNGETYMIKAEIVEHSIVPAPYRYRWQQGEEKFRDFGVESRPCDLDSNYHYTEKVEEFITKVVSEADRGRTAPVALPLSHAWHSVPKRNVQENNRKYDDERDLRRDDRKRLNDGPNWDRRNEPCLNNRGTNTHSMIGSNRDAYERSRGNEGPNARNHPLSKPTNEISTAVEFLKESIKPSYGNGKEKEEFNTSAYNEAGRPTKTIPLDASRWRTSSNMSGPDTKVEPKDYNSEEEEESRNPLNKLDELKIVNNRGGEKRSQDKDGYENPKSNAAAVTKTIPLGATRWRTGINMSGPYTKMEPKDYDSEEEEKECRNPLSKRDELKMVNNRGGEKAFENKGGYENPKKNATASQFGQTAGKKKTPETIDSREASRRYGKWPSWATEEEEYEETITSKEALEKYNGVLVPR